MSVDQASAASVAHPKIARLQHDGRTGARRRSPTMPSVTWHRCISADDTGRENRGQRTHRRQMEGGQNGGASEGDGLRVEAIEQRNHKHSASTRAIERRPGARYRSEDGIAHWDAIHCSVSSSVRQPHQPRWMLRSLMSLPQRSSSFISNGRLLRRGAYRFRAHAFELLQRVRLLGPALEHLG